MKEQIGVASTIQAIVTQPRVGHKTVQYGWLDVVPKIPLGLERTRRYAKKVYFYSTRGELVHFTIFEIVVPEIRMYNAFEYIRRIPKREQGKTVHLPMPEIEETR